MTRHILVIEDAPDLRALYADAFALEGYTVTLADQVPADLTAIDQLQPDVIVLDYLFDGEPLGGQLVQALKQRPATQHIPLLLCTVAARTVQADVPYFHAQQVGLLLKPFELDALLNGIRELLGEPRTDGQTVFVPPLELPPAA